MATTNAPPSTPPPAAGEAAPPAPVPPSAFEKSRLVEHPYTDHADVGERHPHPAPKDAALGPGEDEARLMAEVQGRASCRGTVTIPFPVKLMEILDRDDLTSILDWAPHGRAFVIKERRLFASDVLPRFYRQTKFRSFTRQLNLWGFKRLTKGPDAGAYYHECFLPGRPWLVSRMERRKIKGTGVRPAPNPGGEPDFYRDWPYVVQPPRWKAPGPLPPLPGEAPWAWAAEEARDAAAEDLIARLQEQLPPPSPRAAVKGRGRGNAHAGGSAAGLHLLGRAADFLPAAADGAERRLLKQLLDAAGDGAPAAPREGLTLDAGLKSLVAGAREDLSYLTGTCLGQASNGAAAPVLTPAGPAQKKARRERFTLDAGLKSAVADPRENVSYRAGTWLGQASNNIQENMFGQGWNGTVAPMPTPSSLAQWTARRQSLETDTALKAAVTAHEDMTYPYLNLEPYLPYLNRAKAAALRGRSLRDADLLRAPVEGGAGIGALAPHARPDTAAPFDARLPLPRADAAAMIARNAAQNARRLEELMGGRGAGARDLFGGGVAGSDGARWG